MLLSTAVIPPQQPPSYARLGRARAPVPTRTKKAGRNCSGLLWFMVRLLCRGNGRDEVGAVRRAESGDVVPAWGGCQRTVGAEADRVPTSRSSVVQRTYEISAALHRSHQFVSSVEDVSVGRGVSVASDVVRPGYVENVGDGTGRQTVKNGSSLAEPCPGSLSGDRPDTRKRGTGKAGSADDGDKGFSAFGIDNLDAGVGISHHCDVRNEPPGAGQTRLVRRYRPDTAGAPTCTKNEALEERRDDRRIGRIVCDAGYVVAPTRLQLYGGGGVEKQAGSADAGRVGRRRRHGNGSRTVGEQEVSVVAAGEIDRDAERGARFVDRILNNEFSRIVGGQISLFDAVAVGDH